MTRPPPIRPARSRRSSAAADWHSRVVNLLRVLLPMTALALVGLVIAWPHLMGNAGGLIVPVLTPSQVDGADVMMMQGPRYVGQTKGDDAYEVTASSAYLDPAKPNRIHLDRLAADIDSRGQRDLRVMATSGIYNRNTENLDLSGGIELNTSDGYRFKTESAWLNLQRGRVIGRTPIAGSGPAGTLSADRFEVQDGGDVLRFKGRVKVILYPHAAEDART